MLDNFDASFELDIDLSSTVNHDFTLSLLKKTVEAESVVVEVDFQLYLAATAHEEVSFTAGINLSVSCYFLLGGLDLLRLQSSLEILSLS